MTFQNAPVEVPSTFGTDEIYHTPIRASYLDKSMELDLETTDIECFIMAVFSVNSTMGPDGFGPFVLVFGLNSHPARIRPSISLIEISTVIEVAMVEVEKY